MKRGRSSKIAKGVLVSLLLPVLIGVFWLEVSVGASFVWGALVGYVSPSQPQIFGGLILMMLTVAGPASSVVVACKTRHQSMNTLDRLFRVECLGLLIAVPLVCLGVCVVAAGSII
jgi:hypothetical protein